MFAPLAVACGSQGAQPSEEESKPKNAQMMDAQMMDAQVMMAGSAGAAPMQPKDPMNAQDGKEPFMPFGADADIVPWSTGKFMLEANQERYLCFAATIDDDRTVNGYFTQNAPFVHHLIFSRASVPDPEGFSECDIAFRNTWEPLFITGTGNSALEFPQDAGHQLTKGTQLVLQMHLLNQTDSPVEGSVTINMRRSSVANPRPVSSYIFGTAAVQLPAKQTSQVVGTCSTWQSVQLIAGFPHMHLLGTAMHFEVGTSENDLHEVFKRDPFDFDNQRIDKVETTINAGDVTRVTCTYDNPMDHAIGYGESTHDEMCYFVGFAVDQPAQSACLEVLPPFN
jgi:hypothetical protein